MTRNQAFEQLTQERGWYKKLNISEKAASSAKLMFRKGKLSSDKVTEILNLAGFKVVQQELWQGCDLIK
ncbi:hypothetical protein ACVWYN_002689 [Pedobacter sp. UYP24]